jgi:TOMM system kinase/cyclase fusion protein
MQGQTVVNGYELLAKLGEGGFTTVYQARQLTTGQIVALKILRFTDGEEARRLREIQMCAQLRHPHIAQIIDAGQASDRSLYIACAYMPGDNLAELLAREGPLAPREARHLMLQVLDAMACAHAQGIVHRDLKPSNLLIVGTGARRNAVVLDFGISALLDDVPAVAPRLTASHDSSGTPVYTAPEQSRGAPPSAAADLFSWGLVFLECLTGRAVYRGEPVALPAELARHPLGALLRRAVDIDPTAREASASAILRALESCEVPETAGGSWTAGRHHVTVLCCTWLVGGAHANAEAIDDALRASSTLACAIIAQHRGCVVGAAGQHLVAYFGYPSVEEDAARRAARAALAIREAMAAVSSVALDARIAIHAGPVVVGDLGPSFAIGVTVQVAVELAARATAGTIVVSAAGQRLLRGRFVVTSADDHATLGAELSAHAWSTGGDPSPSWVGRDQELELLAARWRSARAGRGHACLITGESGIGKTRLVRELQAHAAQDVHVVLEARCAPDTQLNTLFAIALALERVLDLDRCASVDAKTRQLADQLAAYGLVVTDVMPLFLALFSLPFTDAYPALDVAPPRHKLLTLQAIAALLFAIAEAQPLLLWIEDLHWADTTTLDLITLLIRDVPSSAMCILMTARPGPALPLPNAGVLQLQLVRLEPAEVRAMISSLVGQAPPSAHAIDQHAIDQIVSRSDGLPLFVEELTRMVHESGPSPDVPSTLRALLTARLARLGHARHTVQLAATLGRELRLDVLLAASPLAASAVEHDLEQLTIAGLIVRKRRGQEPIAIFKHALVRDAVYETMSRDAREEAHARIAATLEARFPDIVRARPDLLAHHHAAAARYGDAVRHALLTAQQAFRRAAYEVAIAHANHVLGWLSAFDTDDKLELELAANGILVQALVMVHGRADLQVKQVVARVRELLRRVERSSPHRVAILRALFVYYHLDSHRADARAIAEDLVATANASGDRGLQAAAYSFLTQTLSPEGKMRDAARAAERAIELYDPDAHHDHGAKFGRDTLVAAQVFLALIRWLQGDRNGAFDLARNGLEWARSLGHAPSLALGLIYASMVYQLAGDRQTATEITVELGSLVKSSGIILPETSGAIVQAWALDDVARLEALIESLTTTDSKIALTYFGSLIADSLARRGDFAAAIARIEECIRLCTINGEHFFEPELYRLRAVYRLQHADVDEPAARESLSTSIRLAREYGIGWTEALAVEQLRALDRVVAASG